MLDWVCVFVCVTDGEVSHTYGPLDGSLYATVRHKKGASEGAGAVISSVHTVSMDSGISSAGNGLLNQPTVAAHRALDELLSDMLMTVENIPDLPPEARAPDIPYHARQDSEPFTYGSVGPGDMLRPQSGLSSPSLVRKTIPRRSNSSHSVPTARSPDFHDG